ncbi:DUF7523 family protein [Natronobeatus ordinarius]|uniref:DUF7523 family protein n=1 Tax=Natronobeatus ordinarius TaxID=2963433 RepID=UPI0020CDE525|nr:hypothetical protein [Natronobeatus ordinarius]
MSLAAETRRAVEEHPFLVVALRAGVVNYTAAARFLEVDGEVDGEVDAVATALRRYAEELPDYETGAADARVSMQSGIEPVDELEDALLVVGGTAFGPGDGSRTAIVATGAVDASALAATIQALELEGTDVLAAGVGTEAMVVVVDRLDGATAVRAVERALEGVPRLARD